MSFKFESLLVKTSRFILVLGVMIYLENWHKGFCQGEDFDGEKKSDYPDPIALLDGVAAARTSIPPSSLKFEYITSSNFTTRTNVWTVDFEMERRRYHRIDGDKTVFQSVYDGLRVMTYDHETESLDIRDITDQNSSLLFDPRVLGCASVLSWANNASSIMFQKYRERIKSIKTIGNVEVDGNRAWQVQVLLYSSDLKNVFPPMYYWIDPGQNFRVFKYIHGNSDLLRSISSYNNDHYPWLPSEVITEKPNRGRKSKITLLEAVKKSSFAESHWTLESMNIPVGTVVKDYIKNRVLGYWDGKKISEDFVPKDRGPNRRIRRLYLILLVVVLIPILGIVVYKSRKLRVQSAFKSS
ncbi:MAG TPA: hypothetical protein EYM79_05545 [Planctomycetes bacterium]|jgi:hypothetical protein|nr:hypothetical protein [Planctomycetota bacterium]|tara:strand:- start:1244 stop:2305 length:1062 start_codon:yes stop_codon:yes gene_type:complete